MARYWRAFKSQEERKNWETEQKKKDDEFVVCMHYSAKDLEKELYLGTGALTNEGYRFCTVYTYRRKG